MIDNPFAEVGDPIVLLPALRPQAALFHAPLADRHGNVWIGRHKPAMLLAHAARETFVTVEQVVDTGSGDGRSDAPESGRDGEVLPCR